MRTFALCRASCSFWMLREAIPMTGMVSPFFVNVAVLWSSFFQRSSAGPGDGVSVHVLCRTPADHPLRFYDRTSGTVMPYPFVEVAPGRWVRCLYWKEI